LNDNGLSYRNINAVYVTHLHGDHVGGLEYLALCSYFDPSMKDSQIEIIANSHLMRDLWTHVLYGGLRTIQGMRTSLMDFFDVTAIPDNGRFVWEDLEFNIVQSVHIMDGYSIVPSYGLMIHDPDTRKRVFVTGDTQFNPNQIIDFYKQADLIVQDCETTPYKSGVHANYSELKTLPAEIKAKMLLTHYGDNVVATGDNGRGEGIAAEWLGRIGEDGFKLGFAIRGCTVDTQELIGEEAK
jgi:ribonuclease BN (tRNA processing enzyme)